MCGIVALMLRDASQHVCQELYDCLTVMQHRGQDAAGMATTTMTGEATGRTGGVLRLRKANGLVKDVFQTHHMLELKGNVGIGHTRYPTAGTSSSAEAQPFYTNAPYGICLAHNGNLTNSAELKLELARQGRHCNTTSDSEVLLNIFASALMSRGKCVDEVGKEDIFFAVSEVHRRCRGGYAAVILINGIGVVALRDRWGIRPLVYGCRESQSIAKAEWRKARSGSERGSPKPVSSPKGRAAKPAAETSSAFLSSSSDVSTGAVSAPKPILTVAATAAASGGAGGGDIVGNGNAVGLDGSPGKGGEILVRCGSPSYSERNGGKSVARGKIHDFGTPARDYMFASESVALDAAEFTLERDIMPGEGLFVTASGRLFSRQCADNAKLSPCIFEHVYLARPDSIIDGVSVYHARLLMGKKLAEKILRMFPEHDIDVVVPIPDTSRVAALQVAYALGLPYREGFIKNRYVARTFIMPGQKLRKKSVRRKLNPIKLEFNGRNVLLVDDSIVRGTTSEQLVQMARRSGARKVYFCSAAPAIRFPNVYGIDMPTATELIAHGRTDEEVAKRIGADWLVYQDLEDLEDAVREVNPRLNHFDTSCFSGTYVTGDVDREYFARLHAERNEGTKSKRDAKYMSGVDKLDLGKTAGELSSSAEDGANYNIR